MANDANNCSFVGKLAQDARVFPTKNGQGAELRFYTSRRVKEGTNWKWESDFHTATVWGEDAAYAQQHGQKGAELFVSGEYINKTFTDKTGAERTKMEIKPSRVRFILSPPPRQKQQYNNGGQAGGYQQPPQGGYPQQGQQQAPQGGYPQQGGAVAQPNDNIPF